MNTVRKLCLTMSKEGEIMKKNRNNKFVWVFYLIGVFILLSGRLVATPLEDDFEEEVKGAIVINSMYLSQKAITTLDTSSIGITGIKTQLEKARDNLERNVIFPVENVTVSDITTYLSSMPDVLEDTVDYLEWTYYRNKLGKVTKLSFTITYKVWYEVGMAYKNPTLYESGLSTLGKQVLAKTRVVMKQENIANLKTIYAKEKAAHDYIVSTTSYSKIITGDVRDSIYGVEGVLLKQDAVCQGYAEAMKLFMFIENIECRFVRGEVKRSNGKTESHIWNLIKMDDGKWYYLDATWDDPVPDVVGRVTYNYFNVLYNGISSTHLIYSGQNLPAVSTTKYQAPTS